MGSVVFVSVEVGTGVLFSVGSGSLVLDGIDVFVSIVVAVDVPVLVPVFISAVPAVLVAVGVVVVVVFVSMLFSPSALMLITSKESHQTTIAF